MAKLFAADMVDRPSLRRLIRARSSSFMARGMSRFRPRSTPPSSRRPSRSARRAPASCSWFRRRATISSASRTTRIRASRVRSFRPPWIGSLHGCARRSGGSRDFARAGSGELPVTRSLREQEVQDGETTCRSGMSDLRGDRPKDALMSHVLPSAQCSRRSFVGGDARPRGVPLVPAIRTLSPSTGRSAFRTV